MLNKNIVTALILILAGLSSIQQNVLAFFPGVTTGSWVTITPNNPQTSASVCTVTNNADVPLAIVDKTEGLPAETRKITGAGYCGESTTLVPGASCIVGFIGPQPGTAATIQVVEYFDGTDVEVISDPFNIVFASSTPIITSLSPDKTKCCGNYETITITGTGFVPGSTFVKASFYNQKVNVPCTVHSDTLITAPLPLFPDCSCSGKKLVGITVETPAGTTSAVQFTYCNNC